MLTHASFLIGNESGCGPTLDNRREPFHGPGVELGPFGKRQNPIRLGRERDPLLGLGGVLIGQGFRPRDPGITR